MINLRYLLTVFILFFAAIVAQAQFVLEGQVISKSSQLPLAGVEVFNHQSQKIEETDEQGNYTFENLKEGEYQFTLFALQYESKTVFIRIEKDMIYDFELVDLSIELTEAQVVEKREELFAIKQLNDVEGTSVFAGKKTEVVVLSLVKGNLANNNGRQVYAQVSGLNIYEGNDGGLQLNVGGRGLDPNRTSNFNTRQNGYDISADVLGYPESYYSPPSEAMSEIRIIRGAGSLQYGTQFGGLIDFQIRKAPLFKPLEIRTNQTIGSFNAFNSFNAIGFNKNKFSVNAFYNYKVGDGYRPNSEYRSSNFFLALDYRLSTWTKFGFEMTRFNYLAKQAGGLTDQQFEANPRMSTRDRNWFDVDWNLYHFNFKHSFSAFSKLTISLFGLDASRSSVGYRGNPINLNENPITSIDEQDADGNYISPRDLILGKFKNHGAEIRHLTKYRIANKRAVFLIGSKYYKANNTSIQGPGSLGGDADFELQTSTFPDYPNQSDFKFPNLNVALFAENIFYLTDKLSLTPGARFEYIKTKSIGSYNQVVYDNANNVIANTFLNDDKELARKFLLLGVGLGYKKSDEMQFVANVSQNYRSVTFSDIRVVSPTFVIDPDIKDESGITWDVGVKGRVNKILSYDLTAYSVFYNDRIGIVLDDRANRVRKNLGQALISGTESLVSVNFARWITPSERNYKLSAFVNGAYTYSRYLKSEENNVVGNKVEFIPTFNVKTGVEAAYKNLELSAQLTYLSKQFTDVQNSGIAQQGDKRSGIVGEIPAYHIVDMTMSYGFKKFEVSAGVNNLLDANYFTRRATGYPGPGIIPSDGRSYFLTVSYKY